MKRLIMSVLALVLCFGLVVPVYSANETNTMGVTFSASLDQNTLTTSDVDQQIVLTVVASAAVETSSISYTANIDEKLTLVGLEGDGQNVTGATTSLQAGKFSWSATGGAAVAVTTIAKVTVTVPAGTAAGTYDVGITGIELSKDYGMTIIESTASATATLTIEEPTIQGYTAGLTTLDTAVAKNGTVTVNVGVAHSSDNFFNAAELEINYDYTKLSVKSVVSQAHSQEELRYTDNDGVLKIEEFGEDKNFSNSNYTITFTAIEMGEASVTLASAKFVHKDNANKSDLIPATLGNNTVNITISQKTYPVTLPDGNIKGGTEASEGENYTFTVSEYDHYAYTITVKVNGTQVDGTQVTDHQNGTYTINRAVVNGPIEITYTRNGRSYDVSWEGNGAEFVVTKPTTATYGEAFNFTLPKDKTATDNEDGFSYTLEVSINGTKYTDYDVEVGTRNYTIPGTDITGAIVITVTKTTTSTKPFSVTTDGTAAGDATVIQSPVGKLGEASITLKPESGYEYEVTAKMDGESVTVTCNNNTYTVTNVVGDVVFTVNKSLITTGVEVQPYVTLNGTSMFLVTYDITLENGKVPTYNGNVMFFSDNYAAYCWLVIADTLTVEEATKDDMIGAQAGTATKVNYSKDINSTGKIDAADAQFVWNMYEAEYSDFTTATMAQFLAADQHQDMKLDVNDALVIVTAILQNTAQ